MAVLDLRWWIWPCEELETDNIDWKRKGNKIMDDLLKIAKENRVVLIEFYATWCPHCKKMTPVVDDVAALFEGQVPVVRLDIDKHSDLADTIGATSIPTFLIYKDDKEVWRHSGEVDANVLASKINQFLLD